MKPAARRRREGAVRAFVRETFGLRGTLALHRAAFGLDLLRAPVNVMLAPVFLLVRLLALLSRLVRLTRVAGWLRGRKVLLDTAVSREVSARVFGFVGDLQSAEAERSTPPEVLRAAVADYVAVRSAVAEITTVLLVLVFGYLLFNSTFLGVISLAGPVAEMRAQSQAIEGFWAGEGLGRMYYGLFPATLAPWQVLLTGVVLAMAASLVTTFAGLVADPVQLWTGMHRRRLMRLLARLDARRDAGSGLSREHVAARMGDLSDVVLTLWRALRG